jgi:S4 domain protein YaaA
MNTLKIKTEYITLQQLLKIENIIASGGEDKYFLANNEVYVNGEPENRRGKKLYPNDIIKVLGKEYKIE